MKQSMVTVPTPFIEATDSECDCHHRQGACLSASAAGSRHCPDNTLIALCVADQQLACRPALASLLQSVGMGSASRSSPVGGPT